jgi:signal transduction histidine kinase
MVIASTDSRRVFRPADQADTVIRLLHDRRPAAPDCQAWQADVGGRREVYALCPLSIVRWGVKVHQPQGAAFAVIDSLTRNVAFVVMVLFAIAFLLAWGASLSLTRPLATLTAAAERIAEGQLGTPIPAIPADEVGRLGTSLERMRVALKESLERVEKANQELEQRVEQRTSELWRVNLALLERDEQRRLALRKVISAQEDERKRIARELHDETTQTLVALVMSLQLAAEKIQGGEGAKKVEDARALAVRTLDEVHRLIVDLRPSVLDDLGLKSAIQWYADRALKARGVNVRCEFSGLDGRLPFEVETALFRCAQEAMTNIARHSSADAALIQCARRDGRVTIEIEDDGNGFDVAAASKPDEKGRGWGLLGIRERIELLGGTVRIESSPGEGTLVALDVPAGLEASP